MKNRQQNSLVSNPFSSGHGGARFENVVQAVFAALMLAKSEIGYWRGGVIEKIKLQVRVDGYRTDDMLVFCNNPNSERDYKILVAIKHSISITKSDRFVGEVLSDAWADYNNSDLFTRGIDLIALVTGPLSKLEVDHTRVLLEWANNAENAEEYMRRVKATKFSSDSKRRRLDSIRHHLETANGSQRVCDNDFFMFLRHFRLIPIDLDVETSLSSTLLSALLNVHSRGGPRELWGRIIEEVSLINQDAGTLTPQILSEKLADVLTPLGQTIPSSLIPKQFDAEQAARVHYDYAHHLALANLLGTWNESNKVKDSSIVELLAEESYTKWTSGLRRFLNLSDAPVSLSNKQWSIKDRKKLWKTHGKHLSDHDLEVFQRCALKVLALRDPAFDLPLDRRPFANIYEKRLLHSINLRRGIAEGLALIGAQSVALRHCSKNSLEHVALLTVRELLGEAEPEIWGSLNDLLPDLAEAAPAEFLDAVERGLQQNPCPFDFLFAQEGNFGANLHTGLLWSLETLAWDEEYLIKACVLLGKLASRDPGGQLSNRPANSLVTILLPWFPQTTASVEKRKAVLQSLIREVPNEAWKLLLSLLPDPFQSSLGTRKPLWRDTVSSGEEKKVSHEDYMQQISFYAECAVEMAADDVTRLSELIQCLDKLPREIFEKLIQFLSSETVFERSEIERRDIWESLDAFALKHKKFSDADWAFDEKIIEGIEKVAAKLKPQDVIHVYRNLFGQYDSDHYDRDGNHEEQEKNLEERRQQAVREILSDRSISGVLDFAKSVEQPDKVGLSLGAIADTDVDAAIFPSLLGSGNRSLSEFVCGYAGRRREVCGWEWLDDLGMSNWNPRQIAHLLHCLPFTSRTWDRVANYLGDADEEYWKIVPAHYLEEKDHYKTAVDKLNMCGRYDAAANCLYRIHQKGGDLDAPRIVQTLLGAVSSEEIAHRLNSHEITELIEALREHPDAAIEDVMRVEWAYLPLLDHYYKNTSPITLETQLGADPSFFCEVIQLLYRSKDDQQSHQQVGEKDKAKANFAWHLLHRWRTPPGGRPDKTFSFDDFDRWLKQVRRICAESGHLEVALTHVGQVLFYCPADPGGAWINIQVAEMLNGQDAEKMRRGFRMEAYNSRGAHRVYPDGAPELELAEKYRKRAEVLKQAGLRRFSETLTELAQIYESEAQQIIDEHS